MNKKHLYTALYKLAGTDELRPMLRAIYHNNGIIVATNAHVLAEVQFSDYNPDHEDKAINKLGLPEEGRYPDYKSVIPDESTMTELRDDYIYNNLLKSCRNVIATEACTNGRVLINVNGILLDKYYIVKVYRVITLLNERLTIYTSPIPNRPVLFKTEHLTAIIMPNSPNNVADNSSMDDRDPHYYTIKEALAFQNPNAKWYSHP